MRYRLQGNTQTGYMYRTVSARQITLCGLTSSTNYTFEVAAINLGGTGVFSNEVSTTTTGLLSSTFFIILYIHEILFFSFHSMDVRR